MLFGLTQPAVTFCFPDHSAPAATQRLLFLPAQPQTHGEKKKKNIQIRATLTVSRAMKEAVLMATTKAGQSSLKLLLWTSITGTIIEDDILALNDVVKTCLSTVTTRNYLINRFFPFSVFNLFSIK